MMDSKKVKISRKAAKIEKLTINIITFFLVLLAALHELSSYFDVVIMVLQKRAVIIFGCFRYRIFSFYIATPVH